MDTGAGRRRRARAADAREAMTARDSTAVATTACIPVSGLFPSASHPRPGQGAIQLHTRP